MKKIFAFLIATLCTMSAFAGDIIVTSDLENGTYVKGAVQIGAETEIDVYIVAEKTIASALQSDIYLPDGLTAMSGRSTVDGYQLVFTPHPELGNCVRLLWVNTNVGTIDAQTPVLAAKVSVSAKSTLAAGDVEVRVNNLDFAKSYNNEVDDFVSEITLQKTAVINELPEGFAVNFTPFEAEDGDVTLKFNYKSPVNIKNLSFDVQLPKGMYFIDDEEWVSSKVKSTLTASCTGAPTLSHTLGSGDAPTSATIKVVGANTAKSKKYINASESSAELATISACVLTQDDIDEYGWSEGIMTDGVYTIKLANIELEDMNGEKYEGESLASVVFGQPAIQDAILYGHYDNATADIFTKALKNVAMANVTAASMDEDAVIEDVILYNTKTKALSYTRTSDNYGTTVLPFDLMATDDVKLYMPKDISGEGIIIEETDIVPANTPCIFKGKISIELFDIPIPTLDSYIISEQIIGISTLKGTYEATSIAAGAGYYIASNGCFYNDGASIRPFRAYFDGCVSGSKSLKIFEDVETGVNGVTEKLSDEPYYSIQGIRTLNALKGINIKGGKKILVK